MEPEISQAEKILISLVILFCGVANTAIVGRIFKQNRTELRPFHVYQMNYFTSISLTAFVGVLILGRETFSFRGFCPGILLSYFLSISSIYDIFILQVDRLLAVRAPYFYKSRVHLAVSVKAVVAAKVFSLAITIVASIINPIFVYCPACLRCVYVQSVHIYTVSYPVLVTMLITIVVSLYFSIKTNETNSIQPQVNLQMQSCSNARTSNQPSCSDQIASGSLEDQEESISISQMITQMEQLPIETAGEHVQAVTISRDMLMKTLKMNLLTLTLLFLRVPIQVLTIIYEKCDDSLGECDFCFNIMTIMNILQLLIGFLYPIIVMVILELNK